MSEMTQQKEQKHKSYSTWKAAEKKQRSESV